MPCKTIVCMFSSGCSTLTSGPYLQCTKSFGVLLTYNLHILVCRLYKQKEAKGYVAKDNELWVERYIQIAKRNVKYRTTDHPEKLYVHDYIRDEVLTAMRHANFTDPCVQKAVKSFDELIPKYRADIRSGPLYDTGEAETGTQLIGKGKRLKTDAYDSALQHVSQYLRRNGHSGWLDPSPGVDSQPVSLCSYTMAHKRGDELLWSAAHKRTRTK